MGNTDVNPWAAHNSAYSRKFVSSGLEYGAKGLVTVTLFQVKPSCKVLCEGKAASALGGRGKDHAISKTETVRGSKLSGANILKLQTD